MRDVAGLSPGGRVAAIVSRRLCRGVLPEQEESVEVARGRESSGRERRDAGVEFAAPADGSGVLRLMRSTRSVPESRTAPGPGFRVVTTRLYMSGRACLARQTERRTGAYDFF